MDGIATGQRPAAQRGRIPDRDGSLFDLSRYSWLIENVVGVCLRSCERMGRTIEVSIVHYDVSEGCL